MSCEFCNIPPALHTIMSEILTEVLNAIHKYPSHPSLEHSMFVLQEEFGELKKEVYEKLKDRDYKQIQVEGTQVAAMAIRLLLDGDIYGNIWKDAMQNSGT